MKSKPLIIFFSISILIFIAAYLFYEKKNNPESVCEDITEAMVAAIGKMNNCQSKEDCVLLNGCPYGCNNLINKDADFGEFANLSSSFYDACGECDSKCAGALKSGEIDCVEGKCIGTK